MKHVLKAETPYELQTMYKLVIWKITIWDDQTDEIITKTISESLPL